MLRMESTYIHDPSIYDEFKTLYSKSIKLIIDLYLKFDIFSSSWNLTNPKWMDSIMREL